MRRVHTATLKIENFINAETLPKLRFVKFGKAQWITILTTTATKTNERMILMMHVTTGCTIMLEEAVVLLRLLATGEFILL